MGCVINVNAQDHCNKQLVSCRIINYTI